MKYRWILINLFFVQKSIFKVSVLHIVVVWKLTHCFMYSLLRSEGSSDYSDYLLLDWEYELNTWSASCCASFEWTLNSSKIGLEL